MVPIEITAFALLAVCVILLAIVVAVQPRHQPAPPRAGPDAYPMIVVVIVAIGRMWSTTRTP